MCRNIKTLSNFEPPATEEEIRAASLQFVRKISGFNTPSKANEAAFSAAVDDIAGISARLLASLESGAAPKNRQEEAAKARTRAATRVEAGIGQHTGRTLRPCRTHRTGGTISTGCSLNSLRTWRAVQTVGARRTIVSSRPLRPDRTDRTGHAG